MSKFNTVKVPDNITTNLAGGKAYKQSTKLALASLLITSFLCDKAYETEANIIKRLEKYYKELDDKKFFAKAAIYARDKFRLRSISHLAAAIVGEGVATGNYSEEDKKWLKNFFSKIVMRGDDTTEIISAYKARPNAYKNKAGRVQLTNVMKKGFSEAIGRMDAYQLAKYRSDKKETSLVDVVRMCHAKPTTRNGVGLAKLIKGTLKNTETWEAKQTAAGQVGADSATAEERTEQVKAAKKEAWAEFVAKGDKIEYMALLRNLRNILLEADMDTVNKAVELVQKPELVKKGKQLPFRYLTALMAIAPLGHRGAIEALSKALEISVDNVPELPGDTAILVDVSGSMACACQTCGGVRVDHVAGIFAGALFKKNKGAQIVLFGSHGRFYHANPLDSIASISKGCEARSEGTYMAAGFGTLKKSYDRIIVLSDMQTWMERGYGMETREEFKKYAKKYNPNVKLYSFDLAGNGTMQFPEENVFCIAGLSEHAFDVMSKMEEDKAYMIHEIEAIEL